MGTVTQENAENAQATSALAQGLLGQVEILKDIIRQLGGVVAGETKVGTPV